MKRPRKQHPANSTGNYHGNRCLVTLATVLVRGRITPGEESKALRELKGTDKRLGFTANLEMISSLLL